MAHTFTAAGPLQSPYGTLPSADEPAAAADVANAIRNDDARGLAALMADDELLQALGNALQPIIDVRDVKFVGAVDSDGRILSAYVAKGRDAQGQNMIVGFVLRVQNREVVGVN